MLLFFLSIDYYSVHVRLHIPLLAQLRKQLLMCVVNTLRVPDPARCLHACSAIRSCPTLCDPMDCSPPGSSVHGILQPSILEWVTILFSRGSYNPGVEPGSPVWATRDAYIHHIKFSKAVSEYVSIASMLHTAGEKLSWHHIRFAWFQSTCSYHWRLSKRLTTWDVEGTLSF